MVSAREMLHRGSTRLTDRISTLPILALNVHTACNCRCVMCDIWMANAEGREMSVAELDRHVAGIRRLRVQRVMLTGGEPLLHRNLWRMCERFREAGIRVTLVTTGLLISNHADDIAGYVDELVVSIDGAPEVHDGIRRVRHGFERIERGLHVLSHHANRPRVTVRSVVQRLNCGRLVQTIEAIQALPVERLSFLAADVTSDAFNRPNGWSVARQGEIALSEDLLPTFAAAISEAEKRCVSALTGGFVIGGSRALWGIHRYYMALAGRSDFARARCNAPWVSAVLEPGGQLRPCFFHSPYEAVAGDFDQALNAPASIAFRKQLDVAQNETCRRCVCRINVPLWRNA